MQQSRQVQGGGAAPYYSHVLSGEPTQVVMFRAVAEELCWQMGKAGRQISEVAAADGDNDPVRCERFSVLESQLKASY